MAIVAGVFALRRRLGVVLFLAVVLLVAAPRMYVGGDCLSDVLAGLGLGLSGSAIARWADRRVRCPWFRAIYRVNCLRGLKGVLVLIWILQMAIEFRDAVWFIRVLYMALHRLV